MSRLLITLFLFSFSAMPSQKIFPIKEKLLKKDKGIKFLNTQMSYIRNRFYTILSINIIPSKSEKTRTSIKKILHGIDKRAALQQKILSKCSFEYTRDCRKNFKSFIDLIESDIGKTKKALRVTKIKYISKTLRNYKISLLEQYLHFNQVYATLNISLDKVSPDHLYSTHKRLRDSVFESFEQFLLLTNQKSANQFIGFIHRFILPTHHLIGTSGKHVTLTRNFEHLSKTLYDFSFYMDKFAKISKKTKISANAMMNHWNQIHKYFIQR